MVQPGASRRAEATAPLGARQGWWSLAGPDSPVLAVLSIPTRTLPPSPPLRLLCAEAAFRGLVLQGGERARKGRLMPAEPGGDTTGQRKECGSQGGQNRGQGQHMEKEEKAESVLNDKQETPR